MGLGSEQAPGGIWVAAWYNWCRMVCLQADLSHFPNLRSRKAAPMWELPSSHGRNHKDLWAFPKIFGVPAMWSREQKECPVNSLLALRPLCPCSKAVVVGLFSPVTGLEDLLKLCQLWHRGLGKNDAPARDAGRQVSESLLTPSPRFKGSSIMYTSFSSLLLS